MSKNYLFNNDGAVYVVNSLENLLDTFTLEEIEASYKINQYYNELNKDMAELVKLGHLIDVNNVGYDQHSHDVSITTIKTYVGINFRKDLLVKWDKELIFDWRSKKPKNIRKIN